MALDLISVVFWLQAGTVLQSPALPHFDLPQVPVVMPPQVPPRDPNDRSAPPIFLDQASWVTIDDYPPDAIAANAQGTVVTTLTVGTDGRVARCIVTRSSGYASLDEATCRALQFRARFQPARGFGGNPVEIDVPKRVTWSLPDPQPTTSAR